MKIRTQVNALLAAALVALALAFGVAWMTSRDVGRELAEMAAAEALITSAEQLRVLVSETEAFHDARLKEHWERGLAGMAEALERISAGSDVDRSSVQRIRGSMSIAKGALERVYAAGDEPLQARSLASLRGITAEISDAGRSMTSAARADTARAADRIALACMLILVTLATLVVFAWWLIRDRILRPLDRLDLDTRHLAAGRQDGRPDLVGGDEISRVAVAFDDMAAQLRQARDAQRDLHAHVSRSTAAAETALRDADALLSTLNLHAIVSIADRAGRIVEVNEAFSRISGYCRDELLGQNHRIVNSGEHPATFWVDMWRTIAGGTPWRGEVCNRAKDGSLYWVDTFIAPFRGESGRVEKYISIRTDISASKQAGMALQMATQQAQAASQAKSQFLANMSHEIRTPMNAILGMLALLRRTELTARQADYAGKTDGAARSLLGLLNEILDFSKVEAGKLALDLQPFRPERLLQDVHVILSANIGTKDVKLAFDVDPALPPCLVGDSMRLQQVLVNLGGNAIKFTLQGVVKVSIRVLAQRAQHVTLAIGVRDTGIGIAAEHQASIFTGFTQAEATTTRRFGGTGLGLAISQRLVALMGGELLLDSALGSGSHFHFAITLALGREDAVDVPERTMPATALPYALVPRLDGMRVLVVEDNLNNQQIARELLEQEGAIVRIAGDGREAVDALAGSVPPPFDAILMDLQMPVMDGHAATRMIRAEPGLGSIPIVAMTANVLPADRQACLDSGMNDHIGKPFDLNELVSMLRRLVGPAEQVVHRDAGVERGEASLFDGAAAAVGLDLHGALARMNGNAAVYHRALSLFVDDVDATLLSLRAASAADQWPAAAAALHALKGVAATVGATAIARRSGEAEFLSRSRQPDAMSATSAIAGLCSALERSAPGWRTLLSAMRPHACAAPVWSMPGPGDTAALAQALRAMSVQLRQSDMAATNAMDGIEHRFGGARTLLLTPLVEAVRRLDFARALPMCERLIADIET